jgi:hypothetical protein
VIAVEVVRVCAQDVPTDTKRQDFASSQPQTADGRPVTSLADVINFGREISAPSPSVVEACRQVAEVHSFKQIRRSAIKDLRQWNGGPSRFHRLEVTSL